MRFNMIPFLALLAILSCNAASGSNWCYEYGRRGDLDKQIEICTHAIYSERALVYLSINRITSGRAHDDDWAIADLPRMIEMNSTRFVAHNRSGDPYFTKTAYCQAMADYNKTIEPEPRSAVSCMDRGDAHARNGNYDQAIADYNKAIELDPRYARAYYGRGTVYSYKTDYDRAIADYNKALELNPKFIHAYYGRGVVYRKKGEYERAIADFNQAIELEVCLLKCCWQERRPAPLAEKTENIFF